MKKPILLALILSLTVLARAEPKPNVIFFLVDDLGWADLACYGSGLHETPHLDRLAASGLRFTDAYTSASVCSPTRASLMTGKHPVRVNITDWIPGGGGGKNKLVCPEDRHELPLEEITIGEAFKAHGYATYYTGKWHLGGTAFAPDKQGFDSYYDPHNAPHKGSPGKGATKRRKHATLELTERTIEFIRSKAAPSANPAGASAVPFFAYVSYFDVHTPIIPVKNRLGHYRNKIAKLDPSPAPIVEHDGVSRPRQDNAAYATMVEAVDESVGEILEALDELKIAERTIIVFTSDNGGLCTLHRRGGPTCNLPLRAGKGWLYEGGIRVPLIIRAPGLAAPGRTTNHQVTSMDFYPTLLSLASLPARPDQHVDGVDFSRIVQGAKIKRNPRPLFWHYPHYHGSAWTPGSAVRDGDWKLVEFHHHGGHELYDLGADPGERHNLAESNPAKARDLLGQLHAWQKRLKARQPVAR